MDNEIENIIQNCNECLNIRQNLPKSALCPWKWIQRPWIRVHYNFVGLLQNKIFLIRVDVTTKWLEVFPVNSMT